MDWFWCKQVFLSLSFSTHLRSSRLTKPCLCFWLFILIITTFGLMPAHFQFVFPNKKFVFPLPYLLSARKKQVWQSTDWIKEWMNEWMMWGLCKKWRAYISQKTTEHLNSIWLSVQNMFMSAIYDKEKRQDPPWWITRWQVGALQWTSWKSTVMDCNSTVIPLSWNSWLADVVAFPHCELFWFWLVV